MKWKSKVKIDGFCARFLGFPQAVPRIAGCGEPFSKVGILNSSFRKTDSKILQNVI